MPLAWRSDSVPSRVAAAPAAQRARCERVWADALWAPLHPGPDVWLHGDLHAYNVLASRGRNTGVLDFGDLCAGDPATDLASGWLLRDRPGRQRLGAVMAADDDACARGQG